MQLKKKRTQLSANPNCWVLHSRTSQSRRALSFSTELITTHKRKQRLQSAHFLSPTVSLHRFLNKKVQVLVAQLCPTPCNPMDCSPPGSPVHGILQARTLEWVAISFSNSWRWKVKVKSFSRVRLWATPWTAAYPAPPSTGFSRQEY